MRLKLAPSLLSADFGCLREQVRIVEAAGVDQIHVDVMDGHFVPNLTMGPLVVEALRKLTDLPIDVHLMITNPEKYLGPFVSAGANWISFHVEVGTDPVPLLEWLGENGIGRGLAISPDTPVERVLDYLPLLDLAVVMTVHPGFGGQTFLEGNLEKVRRLRDRSEELRARARGGRELDIEVDGGVGPDTIIRCRDAGANVFVAGSAIFKALDIGAAVRGLQGSLNEP